MYIHRPTPEYSCAFNHHPFTQACMHTTVTTTVKTENYHQFDKSLESMDSGQITSCNLQKNTDE